MDNFYGGEADETDWIAIEKMINVMMQAIVDEYGARLDPDQSRILNSALMTQFVRVVTETVSRPHRLALFDEVTVNNRAYLEETLDRGPQEVRPDGTWRPH
jgi:hypothetical protein